MEKELINKTIIALGGAISNLKLKDGSIELDEKTHCPEVVFYVSYKAFRKKTQKEDSAYYMFNTKYFPRYKHFVENGTAIGLGRSFQRTIENTHNRMKNS